MYSLPLLPSYISWYVWAMDNGRLSMQAHAATSSKLLCFYLWPSKRFFHPIDWAYSNIRACCTTITAPMAHIQVCIVIIIILSSSSYHHHKWTGKITESSRKIRGLICWYIWKISRGTYEFSSSGWRSSILVTGGQVLCVQLFKIPRKVCFWSRDQTRDHMSKNGESWLRGKKFLLESSNIIHALLLLKWCKTA